MELILFYIALTALNILIVFVSEKIRKKDLSEMNTANERLKSEAKALNKRINDDVIKLSDEDILLGTKKKTIERNMSILQKYI